MTDDPELAAFRAVWSENGLMPYGPARADNYRRHDGSFDMEGMRAADAECDRLNDEVLRRALTAARAAAVRDHPTTDQAHRDDLARDVAHAWSATHPDLRRDIARFVPTAAGALDRLAAAYRPDNGDEVIAPR